LCGPFELLPWFGASGAVHGVGISHDPEPFPAMGRSDIGGAYILPLRIVPERGKAPEYGIEPSKSESADVFHDCESRSKLANKAGILVPEAGSLTRQPSAFTSDGNILAGEAPGDDPVPGGEICAPDRSDVSERFGVGESLLIDSDRIVVNLREVVPVEAKPGPVRAEGEAADASE
jgi:hypothetical protein